MTNRKTTATIATIMAALFALLALAGCADTIRGTAIPTDPPRTVTVPAPQPPPATELTQLAADVLVDNVDEEGISYPSRDELIATVDATCTVIAANQTDLFAAMPVFLAAGYSRADAAYLSGAALVYCALTDEGGVRI